MYPPTKQAACDPHSTIHFQQNLDHKLLPIVSKKDPGGWWTSSSRISRKSGSFRITWIPKSAQKKYSTGFTRELLSSAKEQMRKGLNFSARIWCRPSALPSECRFLIIIGWMPARNQRLKILRKLLTTQMVTMKAHLPSNFKSALRLDTWTLTSN